MTKTLLTNVNINDFNNIIIKKSTPHEAISTYIIANYLFTNLDERINFFEDINELFKVILDKYAVEFLYTNGIIDHSLQNININILKDNIKLVYKGGNIINYYLNVFKIIWDKIDVNINTDTLSDFDFSILINYDYILSKLNLPKTDINYIQLSRLGDLIAYNIIKNFNNYMFCYDSNIFKDSIINNSSIFPNTKYYKFADIDNIKIMEIFKYVEDYFQNIFNLPDNENFFEFLSKNIDKLNNNELKHDLKLHFNIISECAKKKVKFIGFSLPTTFNKHKKIFLEMELINDDNSMQLTTFISHLVNNINRTDPDILSTDNTVKNKIDINKNLKYLNERYDKINTELIESYPSNDSNIYCNLLPLKMVQLYKDQIKNLDNLLTNYDELNFNNFYNINSDKLTLYDDIKYNKFVKFDNLNSLPYNKIYLNKYFNTYENMISISSNFSLLFGTKDKDDNWLQITNFNLERGKIPVRYFFKLDSPYVIEGNNIEYLYVDYLGEFIDISISTYGDSYYREHFISKLSDTDNTEFTKNLNQIEIMGSSIFNRVDILTYSLEYFIFDLYRVLFISSDVKPWKNAKYEKRIGRIAKTFLVYLKTKYNPKDGLQMYNTFIDYIEYVIKEFKESDKIDINIDLIKESIDDIFKDFLLKLDNLSKNILPVDKVQMIQFLEFLICYFKPNIDCISKIQLKIENIKPIDFLNESSESRYLDELYNYV